MRPQGAPVSLEGTRDGRPLAPADVYIAQEGIHPAEVPFKLPEIETEKERAENIFAPPAEGKAGIHVWLSVPSGGQPVPLSRQACEELKALGYLAGDFKCQ